MSSPKIELYALRSMGLIVPCASGVFFSNQTQGAFCSHPEVEGVFIPLDDTDSMGPGDIHGPARKLFDYFGGPCQHPGGGAPLDDEDADSIDSVLRDAGLLETLKVDRSRLRESYEAWVHVQILKDTNYLFTGFGPYPRAGILTWPNTD